MSLVAEPIATLLSLGQGTCGEESPRCLMCLMGGGGRERKMDGWRGKGWRRVTIKGPARGLMRQASGEGGGGTRKRRRNRVFPSSVFAAAGFFCCADLPLGAGALSPHGEFTHCQNGMLVTMREGGGTGHRRVMSEVFFSSSFYSVSDGPGRHIDRVVVERHLLRLTDLFGHRGRRRRGCQKSTGPGCLGSLLGIQLHDTPPARPVLPSSRPHTARPDHGMAQRSAVSVTDLHLLSNAAWGRMGHGRVP